MGIKDFHKWIQTDYSTSFEDHHDDLIFDHLYLDLNFALHKSSYSVKSVDQIYVKLCGFLDKMIQLISPMKSITFATDGVAPLAKLLLQRKRRLTHSRSELITNYSTLNFTPNTKFMETLEDKISSYVNFIKNVYCVDVVFKIKGHDEAELKLKHEMMKNIEKYPNDSHIIVTNDADVIVMLSTLEHYENTYIFCEGINSKILSIGKLIKKHVKKVGASLYPHLDFTAVNMFAGNDYLPSISFFTFEKIWIAYKNVLKYDPRGLVDNKLNINKCFLKSLMVRILMQTKKNFTNKFQLNNYDKKLYDNYFDGLNWCLSTYTNGKCIRYDYMYSHKKKPDPFGIIMICDNNKIFNTEQTECAPLNKVLYGILVLPKKAKNLIDNKYHKFIEKTDIIYTEEDCKKCQQIYDKQRELNKKIEEESDEKKIIAFKKEKNKLIQELKKHKKSHKDLSLEDIKTISEKFEEKFG